MSSPYVQYAYRDAAAPWIPADLIQGVLSICGDLKPQARVLDVGCGNGFLSGLFLKRECRVVGIDRSEAGVAVARREYPRGRFELLEADGNILYSLAEEPFDLVVSMEVVEHVYAPRTFTQGCFAALKPGGTFVCSTPYHGYLKNVLISLLDRFDSHFNPLWDCGHIKFWSPSTLYRLLEEAGFVDMRFRGVGRVPFLWTSMVVGANKPAV